MQNPDQPAVDSAPHDFPMDFYQTNICGFSVIRDRHPPLTDLELYVKLKENRRSGRGV
jgi:hypothetical protein